MRTLALAQFESYVPDLERPELANSRHRSGWAAASALRLKADLAAVEVRRSTIDVRFPRQSGHPRPDRLRSADSPKQKFEVRRLTGKTSEILAGI